MKEKITPQTFANGTEIYADGSFRLSNGGVTPSYHDIDLSEHEAPRSALSLNTSKKILFAGILAGISIKTLSSLYSGGSAEAAEDRTPQDSIQQDRIERQIDHVFDNPISNQLSDGDFSTNGVEHALDWVKINQNLDNTLPHANDVRTQEPVNA